ncbi:MAG: TIGR02186 family protein [Rickettsiales bacterium]
MMRRVVILLCVLFAGQVLAQVDNGRAVTLTNPLIADISQNVIEIRSDFNGAQLLIFGARNAPGELVIAVRGPEVNASLRRKERIAGMWMHVDQRKYDKLPIFYALASTKPLNRIAPPALLQSLGLGENRIIRSGNAVPDELFDKALAHSFGVKHWWQGSFAHISYFGESLFKARLDLPDTLPSGEYTAEVYLFNRGKLLGFQVIPLASYKIGFDANVATTARDHGLVYGVFAILMALFGGWLAHRLFYRG